MNKILIFVVFFLNIFLSNAYSQIAYIDINFILSESIVGKFLNNHLENLGLEYSEKYNKLQNQLVEKENKLLAQKNIIEKNEFDKKLRNLSNEVKKYRENKKIEGDKINNVKIESTKKILKTLNPIITQYVENNEISLVFEKKNIIVGKKDLDITEKIIKILNIKIQKLNFWWKIFFLKRKQI